MEENNNTIFLKGEFGIDITLVSVIAAYNSIGMPKDLTIKINSVGGCIDTGKQIETYIKGLGLDSITTYATEFCASMGSVIHSLGNKRLIEDSCLYMIHNPILVGYIEMNADDLEGEAKQMRELEKYALETYSLVVPNLPKDTISDLLRNNSYMSANTATSLGFCTEVIDTGSEQSPYAEMKAKAVAYFKNDNTNTNNMKDNKDALSTLDKIKAVLGIDVPKTVLELILTKADGMQLTFPDLAEGDTPVVKTEESKGSMAVDEEGKPVDGDVLMNDTETYVYDNGELIEIKPAVEEPATEEDEPAEEAGSLDTLLQALTDFKTSQDEKFALLTDSNTLLKTELEELKKNVGTPSLKTDLKNPKTNTKTDDDSGTNSSKYFAYINK